MKLHLSSLDDTIARLAAVIHEATQGEEEEILTIVGSSDPSYRGSLAWPVEAVALGHTYDNGGLVRVINLSVADNGFMPDRSAGYLLGCLTRHWAAAGAKPKFSLYMEWSGDLFEWDESGTAPLYHRHCCPSAAG